MHYSLGDLAKYKTLNVCPFKVVSFYIVDAFHTTIELSEYPCVETSSSVVEEKSILQTCDPVSIVLEQLISLVSQSLIVLSVEPPPVARIEFLC